MIKIGEGRTFKSIEDAINFFNWKHLDINGNHTEEARATFPIKDNYYAWFPSDVTGKPHNDWVNVLNESKTEITTYNPNLSPKKCKERREKDQSRKFVIFAKINKQPEYELIGIFELAPSDENLFLYKKTSEEFNGM